MITYMFVMLHSFVCLCHLFLVTHPRLRHWGTSWISGTWFLVLLDVWRTQCSGMGLKRSTASVDLMTRNQLFGLMFMFIIALLPYCTRGHAVAHARFRSCQINPAHPRVAPPSACCNSTADWGNVTPHKLTKKLLIKDMRDYTKFDITL